MFNRYLLMGTLALALVNMQTHCAEPPLSRQEVRVIAQINDNLPAYQFFLYADKIEVSSDYLHSSQTIKIVGENPNDPAAPFILQDINFDGYLDIATTELGGAKWGKYHYLVFDKKTGRFVANWLTQELDKFEANEIIPKPDSKEIHVSYISLVEGPLEQTYKVQDERLVLIEEKDIHSGNVVTTKKLVDGKMKVVRTENQ